MIDITSNQKGRSLNGDEAGAAPKTGSSLGGLVRDRFILPLNSPERREEVASETAFTNKFWDSAEPLDGNYPLQRQIRECFDVHNEQLEIKLDSKRITVNFRIVEPKEQSEKQYNFVLLPGNSIKMDSNVAAIYPFLASFLSFLDRSNTNIQGRFFTVTPYDLKLGDFPFKPETIEQCGVITAKILKKLHKKYGKIDQVFAHSLGSILFGLATQHLKDQYLPNHLCLHAAPSSTANVVKRYKGSFFVNLFLRRLGWSFDLESVIVSLSEKMKKRIVVSGVKRDHELPGKANLCFSDRLASIEDITIQVFDPPGQLAHPVGHHSLKVNFLQSNYLLSAGEFLYENENLADGLIRRSSEEFALQTPSRAPQEFLEPLPLLQDGVETIEMEDAPKRGNWLDFDDYVTTHCKGIKTEEARRLAKEGISLIKRIKNGLVIEEPTKEMVMAFCWGVMFHVISKNQLFVDGTVDFEDPGHRIFNFLFNIPSRYGRASSHYITRIIPVEDGRWGKHFGIELDSLPVGMRTVLFGKILSVDGIEHTYLKMEAHGANLHFWSDPNARRNAWQPLHHTVGFIGAMAKRTFPAVFGEVGKGEYIRKEFLLLKDKKIILELIGRIREQDPNIAAPSEEEIIEWGFSIVRKFFEAIILESDTIDSALKEDIQTYIDETYKRYPKPTQKGDEVDMGDSVCEHELSSDDGLEEIAE